MKNRDKQERQRETIIGMEENINKKLKEYKKKPNKS